MTLKLIEYGNAVPLNVEQAIIDDIKKASSTWRKKLRLKTEPIVIAGNVQAGFNIRAIGVAGFISVGAYTIEIAPKFINHNTLGSGWQSAMWRFLMYGFKVRAIGDTSGEIGVEKGLIDFLANLYIASLQGVGAKGYPLGYKETRYDSEFVKGRLDPKRYHTLMPFTGKVGVISSQLTRDIPTNRLLKWAGLELARTVESKEIRKKLISWADELKGVSSLPPKIESVTSIKREYPHLIHSIEIAKMLLEDRNAGFGAGKSTLPGFLWDSNELFERATRRLFDEACHPLGLSVSKKAFPLATSGIKKMQTTPDIDIRSGQTSVLIIDAKYKVKSENPSNEDFYQVMAAGRVRGVNTVALIYPAEGLGVTEQAYKPYGIGLPETVVTLTVGLQSFSSKVETNILIQDIRRWIEIRSKTPVL